MGVRVFDPNRPGKEWRRALTEEELRGRARPRPVQCDRDVLGPCEVCGATHVALDAALVRAGLRYFGGAVALVLLAVVVLVGLYTIASWIR